jgi:hypothetical protein
MHFAYIYIILLIRLSKLNPLFSKPKPHFTIYLILMAMAIVHYNTCHQGGLGKRGGGVVNYKVFITKYRDGLGRLTIHIVVSQRATLSQNGTACLSVFRIQWCAYQTSVIEPRHVPSNPQPIQFNQTLTGNYSEAVVLWQSAVGQ